VWKAKRVSPSGYEGGYDLREIVNAMFYQNRTGCQWHLLPHDLPPWSAVYYFRLWRDDGIDQAIHDLLRCQAREKAGRTEDLARSCWTPSRSGPRTTCPRPRPARTLASACQGVSGV
jgi:transposase